MAGVRVCNLITWEERYIEKPWHEKQEHGGGRERRRVLSTILKKHALTHWNTKMNKTTLRGLTVWSLWKRRLYDENESLWMICVILAIERLRKRTSSSRPAWVTPLSATDQWCQDVKETITVQTQNMAGGDIRKPEPTHSLSILTTQRSCLCPINR